MSPLQITHEQEAQDAASIWPHPIKRAPYYDIHEVVTGMYSQYIFLYTLRADMQLFTDDGVGNLVESFGLNIFYSGIEYADKDWVRLKVRHYPLQIVRAFVLLLRIL